MIKALLSILLAATGSLLAFAGLKIVWVDGAPIGALPLTLAGLCLFLLRLIWRRPKRVAQPGAATPAPPQAASPSIIKHYRFSATFALSTPLSFLMRHGDIHPGPSDALPTVGPGTFGLWLPVTRSWAELAGPHVSPEVRARLENVKVSPEQVKAKLRKMGMREAQLESITELSLNSVQSDIGPVPPDGGDYLRFLKRFRAIVESNQRSEEMRQQVEALLAEAEFQILGPKLSKKLRHWKWQQSVGGSGTQD